MSKDITVQITVQEYGPELYKINETGSFIRKELCTVIKTVEHVQPEPQRKSLGMYDGVEVFEGDITYHIIFKILKILKVKSSSETVFGETECGSKSYLTPKEVNARLKEEVTKKAKKRTFTFAELEYQYDNWLELSVLEYAIELIEKEYNVQYLTINTESK